MKTVYVINYSQLTKPDIDKSAKEFLKHTGLNIDRIKNAAHQEGGSSLSMYKNEELEKIKQGAIYLYKTGQISDTEFVKQMNKKFNTNLNMETFRVCWEEMCTMDETTLESISELAKLQEQKGFEIHIMGGTNPMHVNWINNQLHRLRIDLKYSHTFSFDTGTLDQTPPDASKDLWKDSTIVDLRDKADIFVEIKNAYAKESPKSKGKSPKL